MDNTAVNQIEADRLLIPAGSFWDVVLRLRSALGDARGKIRVSDAQMLAGVDPRSYYGVSVVGRAMQHLGWKRRRCRFDGVLKYGYTKGTQRQTESIIELARREDGELMLIREPHRR